MKNIYEVNENVTVTAVAFGGTKELKSYPRRMIYNGETYTFGELGLRCLIKHGKRIAQIFTVSDGKADYRLRYDDEGHSWTLLGINKTS